MPKDPRSARSSRLARRAPIVVRFVVGLVGWRFDWRPSSAEPVILDVHAPIPGAAARRLDGASGRDWLDDEWRRLWAAAPEDVRYHFSRILNRQAVPRVVLTDNLLPHTERRVEARLALHARRPAGNTSEGGN